VKNRKLFYCALAMLAVMVALVPILLDSGHSQTPVFAQEPTGTPTDQYWLAFSAARAALEEKTGGDFAFVNSWTYEEAEFTGGIDDCHTLMEGEQARQIFFGWRFIITSLSNMQYEVRTSFNYQIISICDKVTAGTAAPTAAANPNLPAPVTGSASTGSFELGGQVPGLYPNTRTALQSAKMKWVKMQLQMGQSGSGLISEAHAAGFKILFSVVGDKSQVMNGSYQDSYASYVGSLAAAGADAIEIWNEMNIDREWPAGQVNGANYVPLLAKAYNAIKAANANTLVITGALAPTGFFGAAGCTDQGCNDDVYVQQMASAGAGNYADCIGVHYNEGIISPSASSGDPRGGYPTYYFGTMLSRAIGPFGNKQACFTEIGYLSPEGYSALPSGFAWAANTSIAEQAQWLAEAAVIGANTGKVRLMIVFNVDFTNYSGSDPMAGFAIVRADGSCPACTTLAGVMK